MYCSKEPDQCLNQPKKATKAGSRAKVSKTDRKRTIDSNRKEIPMRGGSQAASMELLKPSKTSRVATNERNQSMELKSNKALFDDLQSIKEIKESLLETRQKLTDELQAVEIQLREVDEKEQMLGKLLNVVNDYEEKRNKAEDEQGEASTKVGSSKYKTRDLTEDSTDEDVSE